MADPATDALIAELWPREWANANDPTRRNNSKRRQKLRQAYANHLQMQALRLAEPEARCGTCERHELVPDRTSLYHCAMQSDFYGYVCTGVDYLCLHYKKSENKCCNP